MHLNSEKKNIENEKHNFEIVGEILKVITNLTPTYLLQIDTFSRNLL